MIDLAIAPTDLLDDAAYGRIRASLPAWRRERADRYYREADRYASVLAFALLQNLWRERVGGPLPDVVLGEHGKPRFAEEHRHWHFNWSHDRSVCVCAFGTVPVGVDVQSRVPYDDTLFARIAAPGERFLADRLREADDLAPLWTRKEAAVKRTGRGLSVPLDQVDTAAATDILTLADAELGTHLSVSAEGLTEQELRERLRFSVVHPARLPFADPVDGEARVVAAESERQGQWTVRFGRS